MRHFLGYIGKTHIPTALIALATSAPTLAGNPSNITFSAASATPVPTMGGAALLLTAGLLSLLALKQYRHQGGISPMLAGLIATAVVAASGGIQVLNDARAIGGTVVSAPGLQTLNDGTNIFINGAGQALEVTAINYDEACGAGENTTGETECAIGLTLDDQASCGLVLDCGIEPSDRRLKADITQTGFAENGLPLYRFRYINGTQYYEGVMAQDVLSYQPAAVLIGEDGYYRVDYGQLGLKMRAIE
jgi:hypothetical protein